ncbi:hypothetical protein QA640_19670 [Bradyrhizobium sp. CB82]|uniref:DUF6894 family protein n=1 Tax=Bradyrhizobium sp. CB82 TaxID=3039159 RepID=UPI0024B0DCD4|nr:hypothetical protein [Bradyrhizobium sp. CB82]WFU44463.1 hypothetical protein QA640_19670 [Bradyrhizobium sp. CB82]
MTTRYYFDIRDGSDLQADEVGLELPCQRAAEMEAARTLAGMAQDHATLDRQRNMVIEVRTGAGSIFTAAFILESNEND